jgi:hypothetical protein
LNEEGISLKKFLKLVIVKLTGFKNVSIKFIQLNRPDKKAFRFFKVLQGNVRARGFLKNHVTDIFLIFYQSFILKSPKILGDFLCILIKKNIKKVRPIFLCLSLMFPFFSRVLKLKGVRLQLKGRINGAKRTRRLKSQYGRIPMSTVTSDVCYSFNSIMTIHGLYSLRL